MIVNYDINAINIFKYKWYWQKPLIDLGMHNCDRIYLTVFIWTIIV
jgi:hypothetical protein